LRFTLACVLVTQLAWVAAQPWLPARSGVENQTVVRGDYATRLELVRDAFEIWKLNPLVGVGFNNFSPARVELLQTPMLEPNASRPHNLVMELLAEWGLLGMATAGIPTLLVFRAVTRQRRQLSPEETFALLVVSVTLIYSLLEYPLGYFHFLLPFALALGLLRQPAKTWTAGRGHAAGFVVCCMVTVFVAVVAVLDYLPLQRSYTEVSQRLRRGETVTVTASVELADKVAGATLYPAQAAYLFARTMEPDGLYMEFKLEMSREVMKARPNGETMARYLAFCILLDREDEAEEALHDAARNPSMWTETMQILGLYARERAGVQDYLERKGLLQRP
jgi:hypothetical protein